MLYTIRNDCLTLEVDDLGAQMMALTGADGTEYLWNGDAAFWRNRAPNLFPYVGRSTEDSCTIRGVRYPMSRHGFANRSRFSVGSHGADRIVFTITDSPETRENYPWAFAFSVGYALVGNGVEITYEVINRDREPICFGLGGHPGFRVPLEPGLCFTDYALTFANPCSPDRVELSENYMISGRESRFPLENGDTLPLRHDLFDHDAVILRHMDKTVTLSALGGQRGVRLEIPRMNYLGIWHTPEKEAPFVCLEPWVSLPARQDVVEELTQQGDLITLLPGERYVNPWKIVAL